jgi:hypothetical protein
MRWVSHGLSDEEVSLLLTSWNQKNMPPKEALSDPSSREVQDLIRTARVKYQPSESTDKWQTVIKK